MKLHQASYYFRMLEEVRKFDFFFVRHSGNLSEKLAKN